MKSTSDFFQRYYDERMQLFPLEATSNGDNRYNDRLPNDISESYRDSVRKFAQKYLDELVQFDTSSLNTAEKISYQNLHWDLTMMLEDLKFDDHLTPINQFSSLTLSFGQMGSGKSIQPFKTVKDYDNFLGRVDGFVLWCDTAIANMRKGMATGVVNPKVVMERTLPQLKAMFSSSGNDKGNQEMDVTESIFYMPVRDFPVSFSDTDRRRLDSLYKDAIASKIIPSYKKLYNFIKEEYIPKCRTEVGISTLTGGRERYNFLIKYYTTTNMTAEEIFDLGQHEVERIKAQMEEVKNQTGFKGNLKQFFTYQNTDKKFFPFHSAEEVLQAYEKIHQRMKPQLQNLFDVEPKTKFEIRQTEKFRDASASAEYQPGTPDGSRPGVFYVPIPDVRKFNTYAMEDLFLHEAIPGHHYQISLQQENDSLPKFRRFSWYGAYGEGWALYTESLGKELGLYTDPYQYFGMLSEEMHRAIRLVVDIGIHTKGWTREQAIDFSLENEGESIELIVPEIERYIAIPGQALGYKVGQLKILELRAKAEKELNAKFNIAKFHDAVLDSGVLPLSVLEAKINDWIKKQRDIS